MKKVFFLVFTFSFFAVTPFASAEAVEDELRLQVVALTEYLENILQPQGILTVEEERQIISDSAAWIVASQKVNGRYGYEYFPYKDRYAPEDNTVRQAGTFSTLADIYKHQTLKDKEIAKSLAISVKYFESLTAEIDNDEGDFLCIKKDEESGRCDLGATALVLVGLFNFIEADPKRRGDYEELIAGYVDFLLAAKRPEAGFSNRYLFKGGFKNEESPFFNGEAMLALVRYYQYHPNEETRLLLEELFEYLSRKEYESPLYLWIMSALKDMNELWPNEAYVAYAKDFTRVRLSSASLRRGTNHNYCAPVEGLVSAYSVLQNIEDSPYLYRLYSEIQFWLKKSAGLQLTSGSPYRVVFENERLKLVRQDDPEQAHGGFLTGETELSQRIDFTQHCASAYLQKLVDIDNKNLP